MNGAFINIQTLTGLYLLLACLPCNAQDPIKKPNDTAVGDYCDGCETMYAGIPNWDNITPRAAIADGHEPGERMEIAGQVFRKDGKTPAKDIILYIYHTDATGNYSPAAGQTEARRNGHLRGWARTDASGHFTIASIRPAPYPGRGIPAHIHILVKEPGKTLYYIDEIRFDDDPLNTPEERSKTKRRGGDLLIHLTKDLHQVWQGSVKITLGLNIPGYK